MGDDGKPVQLIDAGSKLVLEFLDGGTIRVSFKSVSSDGNVYEDQETYNDFDEVLELMIRIQEEQDMEDMGMVAEWN